MPVPVEERTPRLKSTATNALSEKTKTILDERGISLQGAPVNRQLFPSLLLSPPILSLLTVSGI